MLSYCFGLLLDFRIGTIINMIEKTIAAAFLICLIAPIVAQEGAVEPGQPQTVAPTSANE